MVLGDIDLSGNTKYLISIADGPLSKGRREYPFTPHSIVKKAGYLGTNELLSFIDGIILDIYPHSFLIERSIDLKTVGQDTIVHHIRPMTLHWINVHFNTLIKNKDNIEEEIMYLETLKSFYEQK